MVLPLLAIVAIGAVAGAGLGAAVGPKEVPMWQRMLGGAAMGGLAGAGVGGAIGAGAAGAGAGTAAVGTGSVLAPSAATLAAPTVAAGLSPALTTAAGLGAAAPVGTGSVLAGSASTALSPVLAGATAGAPASTGIAGGAMGLLGKAGAAVAANPLKTAMGVTALAGGIDKLSQKKKKDKSGKQNDWGKSGSATWEGGGGSTGNVRTGPVGGATERPATVTSAPAPAQAAPDSGGQFAGAVARANAGRQAANDFTPRGVNNRWQDEEEKNPYARRPDGQFVLPRRF
jgi:hypothetical protein